ncbi:DUF1194 domain-containing protein [Aquamicrobium sp. LC103]|uniref:DUF1194 domain-containing protein n=1 Tax=Aquamicrobium sp. LC103 TaxID=1120658 RepID=UPI00063EC2D4|nr:DUF1194 domain-containing protein [Aquamicrobium sp. LC103]TKT80056.1 DUF1194 domain-containing protein [Aquamicrobium sp. LC103]
MARLRKIRRGLVTGASAALIAAFLPQAAEAEQVDVELILAVDVSLSMSPDELAIQRDGYAAALTHEVVLRAIQDGVHGKIALTYVEWAGATVQHVVVPWTVIATLEDAKAVAEKLTIHPPNSARRTSISGALQFAGDLFAESGHRGLKRVVDISGDGPNNQGSPVAEARDALVRQGITVNGLPLMTTGGFTSAYDVPNLDLYYSNCVIGGPGAFMIPVNDWAQFPEAVRRKLVLELVDAVPDTEDEGGLPVIKAAAERSYDCMVGEKMWRDRSWMWDSR